MTRAMGILKRVWSVFTSIMIALVVVLAILLVGIRLVGIKPYTVISGSMEPTYHVGSMIYVKSFPAASFEVKDPVTFYLNDTTVATHRIIEILPDPNDPNARYFRTQGDANDTDDGEPIHSSKVIGRPLFSIPYLGYFSDFLQHQPGRSIALGTCTLLLIAAILPGLWPKKPDKAEPAPAEESAEADDQPKG